MGALPLRPSQLILQECSAERRRSCRSSCTLPQYADYFMTGVRTSADGLTMMLIPRTEGGEFVIFPSSYNVSGWLIMDASSPPPSRDQAHQDQLLLRCWHCVCLV